MMMWERRWRTLTAIAIAMVAVAGQRPAAAVVIDDFSSASATLFVSNTQVAQAFVGSITGSDSNLIGVIGGVRQLTVTVTSNQFQPPPPAPPALFLTSGVELGPNELVYAADPGVSGWVDLLYDRGGVGLSGDLAFAEGVRIIVSNSCPGADPFNLSLTLVDGSGNATTVVQSLEHSGEPIIVDFPFFDFAGIDLWDLFSVRVTLEPVNPAVDMRLGIISTFGILAPAPVLSPTMIRVLLATLGIVGFVAMARLRRGRHG